MGNYFFKESPIITINKKDLQAKLLHQDLYERIRYLETKLDTLDAKIWSIESTTKAQFYVVDHDVNNLIKQLNSKTN